MARAMKTASGTLLMPKATAVWLIENTKLTFRQIAEFVGLTEVEIETLANGDIGRGLVGRNPVENNELSQEELDRCQEDPAATLAAKKNDLPQVKKRAKGPRYTPVSKRADKPNAILYILKNNPEITDAQITKLVGTTKPTIKSIRERTHANMSNIRAQHPADLGLCSYQEYEKAVEKGLKAQGKTPGAQTEAKDTAEDGESDGHGDFGFDFSNFLGTETKTEAE